ncbi:MAG: GPW/gp25 family protein [Bacteroidota bacterium]
MANDKRGSFLGRGWSFPPTFDPEHINITMVEKELDIKQSLYILLSTIPGERTMRPDFGCDLHGVTFSRMIEDTRRTIIDLVATAILHHEPRVTIEEIEVNMADDDEGGTVYINIDYKVRETNVRENIVYPFHLIEGTNITEI